MAATLGLNFDKTHEVKIYAETAKELFDLCFAKANIKAKRNASKLLLEAILEEFSDSRISVEYIRNTYNEIEKTIREHTEQQEMCFLYTNVYTLAMYAGIDDYKTFNKKFNRSVLDAVYVSRPFKLLNFLRIGDHGTISLQSGLFVYKSPDGCTITGSVQNFSCFTMPGDYSPLWIKVMYKIDEKTDEAYFGMFDGADLVIQSNKSILFAFFKSICR